MKKAILLGVVLAATLPAPARAADPPAAADSQSLANRAQALADRAYEAYQSADWHKAVSLYLESYKLVPSAEILYNIANIYDRKLGDKQTAIDFYRRHNTSSDADPGLLLRANARVAELSRDDKSAATAPAPAAPAAPPAALKPESPDPKSDAGGTLRTTGYVLGALGIVGLGVGTGLGVFAMGRASDAHAAGCQAGTCPDAASAGKDRSAAALGNGSTIGFVAGGALVASGLALVLIGRRPHGNESTPPASAALRLAPSVGPAGAGLVLSGVTF